VLRHLLAHPLKHPLRRVPLPPRRPLVLLQHAVDEQYNLSHQSCWFTLDLLALRWEGIPDGISHHPPVHAQFPGHTLDRSDAFFVFAPDLLEQFHFGSPIQPAAPSGWMYQPETKLSGFV
jgi:hypothetical protein